MTSVNARSSSNDIAGHREEQTNTAHARGKAIMGKDVADSLGMRENKRDDTRHDSNGSASAKGFKLPKLPFKWPRCPDIIKPPIGVRPPIDVINPPVGTLPPITVKPPFIPGTPPPHTKFPPGSPVRPEMPIVILPPGRGIKHPIAPNLPSIIAIPVPKEPPRNPHPGRGVEPRPPVRTKPIELVARLAEQLSQAIMKK